MGKKDKKKIRELFRISVFTRDRYKCRVCEKAQTKLDAHHITDRNLLPNGGYVATNGISLCEACHIKAEVYHVTGTAMANFSPEDLYKLIDSSYEKAHTDSLELGA